MVVTCTDGLALETASAPVKLVLLLLKDMSLFQIAMQGRHYFVPIR